MSYSCRALIASVAAIVMGAGLPPQAWAAPAERSQPAPTQPAPENKDAKPGDAKPAAAKVTGFRSAQFGMTIDDVTKAIAKDFRVPANAIQREANPTERTTSLIARVDDLQVGAGPAVIAYIFGYSSQKLFRVNILWGGGANPKSDANTLVGTANSLRNYFVSQGYQSEGMVLNAPVGDGAQVVVFRGVDAQGRMTLLTLSVPPAAAAGPAPTPATAEPASLLLSYIEKPGEPDIFKIEKGF